ncbi:MAG: oligopeptide/dipeptide ABC transporter ATP-binding protein [Pseudomonadota bacterium]
MMNRQSAIAPDALILEVTDLRKAFPVRSGFLQRLTGSVSAVDGVSFAITRGQTLGLVGESGCGKSTVARLILRLLSPDSGIIRFNGHDISRLSQRALKPLRRQIQIIFQDPYGSLNPRMSIGWSIAEGLRTIGITEAAAQRSRVAMLLEMVGLPPAYQNRYPHEFSGGQRQRIGIARALSVSPSLLVCDEPISALDVSIQAQIINLLKDLQDQLGLSYLFISHDLNVVSYLCTHVCVMNSGQIVESAPAEALFEHPCHPYTRALLSAIPDADASLKMRDAAPARPRRDDPPPGACVYADECPAAEPRCLAGAPLITVAPGHQVRCWQGADVLK